MKFVVAAVAEIEKLEAVCDGLPPRFADWTPEQREAFTAQSGRAMREQNSAGTQASLLHIAANCPSSATGDRRQERTPMGHQEGYRSSGQEPDARRGTFPASSFLA